MGQINILNYTHSVGAWWAHLEYSPMLHNLCTKLEKNPGVQINIAMRFAFMMGKIPKCKLCVTCCRQQFQVDKLSNVIQMKALCAAVENTVLTSDDVDEIASREVNKQVSMLCI